MKQIISKYTAIHRIIIYLMMVDFSLQLINSAFTLLLNYVMLEHGFKDYQITSMVGNRYLTVLLCAIPLAVVVKGKKLKPFILAGAISSPAVALLLIWGIHSHNTELIRTLMALWGVAFSLVQVLVLPYVLLNGSREYETEAIALFFSAGNFTIIITGVLSYVLPLLSNIFSTEVLLIIYSAIGFMGVFFATRLPEEENIGSKIPWTNLHSDYDWNLIMQATIPTFIIAFGAGFTIPFINLFFKNVHGMEAGPFSLMNSAAFGLVVITAFFIPEIKRRFGYNIAITLVQSLAIIALFVLGATEWFKGNHWAIVVAIAAFIIRQPLMNMAGPMTSELTLNYVGEKNREMISALSAAIWSGCWFASAKIFSVLREAAIEYSNIIFITVGFYIIGVAWYYWLIKAHERKNA
ncbi:MAG TPA: MFS transporter [Chitinophagales bacterium]|nr:MFS transporter [Chitinophagales bacterium]